MARSFKYVGPYDEVHIPVAGLVVKHGETVVIEDPDVAAGLDGQETWQHIPAKKRAARKRAAKKTAAKKPTETPAEPSADSED